MSTCQRVSAALGSCAVARALHLRVRAAFRRILLLGGGGGGEGAGGSSLQNLHKMVAVVSHDDAPVAVDSDAALRVVELEAARPSAAAVNNLLRVRRQRLPGFNVKYGRIINNASLRRAVVATR